MTIENADPEFELWLVSNVLKGAHAPNPAAAVQIAKEVCEDVLPMVRIEKAALAAWHLQDLTSDAQLPAEENKPHVCSRAKQCDVY